MELKCHEYLIKFLIFIIATANILHKLNLPHVSFTYMVIKELALLIHFCGCTILQNYIIWSKDLPHCEESVISCQTEKLALWRILLGEIVSFLMCGYLLGRSSLLFCLYINLRCCFSIK